MDKACSNGCGSQPPPAKAPGTTPPPAPPPNPAPPPPAPTPSNPPPPPSLGPYMGGYYYYHPHPLPPPPPHWQADRRPRRHAPLPHMEDFERISRNPRVGYIEHTRTWRVGNYPIPPPDYYHGPPPPPPPPPPDNGDYYHYGRGGPAVHHHYYPQTYNDGYFGGEDPNGCPTM